MADRWEQSPQLQVHDVVQVELSEAPVVVLSEHRSICDQTDDGEEGLFEPVPDHVLVGVRHIWILSGEDRQVGHDAVCVDRKRLEWTRVSTRLGTSAPPVVQICGVCQPGPQSLQQDPGGAKRPSFGLLG